MHLYTPEGRAIYEVPYASDPDRMRTPTLADARKLGLFPSVTEITSVLNRPGLNKWKEQMAIEAALTHPQDGRPVDDLVPEIRANAKEFSKIAMEFGTMVHSQIEDIVSEIEGWLGPKPDLTIPGEIVDAFRSWYAAEGAKADGIERSFASDCGYGGRVDWIGTLDGKLAVIDWKTQGTRPGEKVRYYPEWAAQLAAYANGLGYWIKAVDLVSVVISTTELGRIESKVWGDGKVSNSEWLDAFFAAFELWKSPLCKNYDPLEV
jgi:hypothetical protein